MPAFYYYLIASMVYMISANALALPFGVYDPRSLAMGGTGVSSSKTSNAVFYNPALIAQYDEYEEDSRNSTFVFPSVTAGLSDSVETVEDFRQQDLDKNLTLAIENFNADQSMQNAQAVLDASLALQDGLSQISGGPVYADGVASFVITIPSKRQGGAFVFSKRAVGDGLIDYTEEDAQLLDAYVETMSFLTGGGGTPQPEVCENNDVANCVLINPTDSLTSSASAAGMIITELGVAMSGEFNIFKNKIALGVTPKFVNVETYDVLSSTNESPDSNEDNSSEWDINFDVGAAYRMGRQWTLGLTIKNIIPQSYTTNLNNELSIDPAVRAGVAYIQRWGTIALDVDVLKNDSVGSGADTQFVGMGGEWDFRWGALRGGYSHNFAAPDDVPNGIVTVGAGFTPFGIILDFAYADNSAERAASFQFGFHF